MQMAPIEGGANQQPMHTTQPGMQGYSVLPPVGSIPAGPPEIPPPSMGMPPPPMGMHPPPMGMPPPPIGMSPPPMGMPPPPPPGAPVQTQWMLPPPAPVNCPPGLEYLTQVDQLLVHQQVELLEAFTGFETNNKYEIKNSLGQRVYFAAEDTDCCARYCLSNNRPFDIQILDNTNREVIHLSAPFRCDSCLCPCFLKTVEVQAPPGQVCGYVKQCWSLLTPKYAIQNAAGQTVLTIEGPCLACMCGEVQFKVMSADGATQVGTIEKQFSGLVKEMFTDADNFGVTFPMDLDVNMKATLLGAVFLIDFMYFEKGSDEQGHVNFD